MGEDRTFLLAKNGDWISDVSQLEPKHGGEGGKVYCM